MPSINLPTAVKQDDIQVKVLDIQSNTDIVKQTVNDIASNFPLDISGGTDFLGMTPLSILGSSNAPSNNTTYRTMLDIAGGGIITHISTLNSSGLPILKIIVDGVEVFVDLELPIYSTFSFFIPFKTSLKVELKSKSSSSQSKCTILYLLN